MQPAEAPFGRGGIAAGMAATRRRAAEGFPLLGRHDQSVSGGVEPMKKPRPEQARG